METPIICCVYYITQNLKVPAEGLQRAKNPSPANKTTTLCLYRQYTHNASNQPEIIHTDQIIIARRQNTQFVTQFCAQKPP